MPVPAAPLAILAIDDSHADVARIQRHCRRHGLAAEWHRIDRRDQLEEVLRLRQWQLVLCDYNVPGMDFCDSMAFISRMRPELPVILMSSQIGEERAVDLMKLGLQDFVLKDNLHRLVPAIDNALRHAEETRARFAAEARTERERLRLKTILKTASDGIHILDRDGLLIEANDAFLAMLGYDEQAIGTLKVTDWDIEDSWPAIKARHDALIAGHGHALYESAHRRRDGSLVAVEISVSGIEIGGDGFLYAASRDITERKKAEEQIWELAYFDHLTGLPNRRLLQDRLTQALAACGRQQRRGALLCIDLDNFKAVNDTLGHDIGDRLLRETANRLKAGFRGADSVARIGGDEFMVVLNGLSPETEAAATQAEAAALKVLTALSAVCVIGENEIHTSCSIGIALFGEEHRGIDELMKQADIALYQSKSAGRNCLHFFNPDLQMAIKERTTIEAALRHGISHDQLLLHYQPQIDASGRIIGAEALVRWQHPDRGLVPPAYFIPLAEESGLIVGLGDWVLHEGCRQSAAWARQSETADLTLAMNVSAQQFRHKDFVSKVMLAVDRGGANPRKIKLELTESTFLENVSDVIAKMTELKNLGFGFSLDDFGTGYSCLSYLKLLPLSQLKIDQSFVRDIIGNANDIAIARTIVALGDNLGLNVIAEGVENTAQRDLLAGFGCHAYQGFFFSRPLALADFQQLFAAGTVAG